MSKKRSASIPTLASTAGSLARSFRIVLQPDAGRIRARVAEFPGLIVEGSSPEQALANALFALETTIVAMIESGQTPPTSADQARTQQVNVRLTAAEKAGLQERAESEGFRGLSDYIRAKVIVDV